MSVKILPFTPRVQSPERRPDPTASWGAILMFTGVRYERLPEAPATKRVRTPKRRQSRAVPAG